MSKEQCAKFTDSITRKILSDFHLYPEIDDGCPADDPRIKKVFDEYDKDKDTKSEHRIKRFTWKILLKLLDSHFAKRFTVSTTAIPWMIFL